MNESKWVPLESNPDSLNKFLDRVGVKNEIKFCDVYGIDDIFLDMIPKPVLAICLLFPSQNISKSRRELFSNSEKIVKDPASKNIFYIKQLDQLGNACGTIATLHALANNKCVEYTQDSIAKKFFDLNYGLDATIICNNLAHSNELFEASDLSATDETTQTAAPNPNDPVDSHFITLVNIGGKLVELDGRMPGPLEHGPTTSDSFLCDAVKIVKEQFMDLDPNNITFNMVALYMS